MSTIIGPTPSPEPFLPEKDPVYYGVRYIPRTLEDGTVVYDEVPLRQEDLLFPTEWDHYVHNEGHQLDCVYLQIVFTQLLSKVEGAKVLVDMLVEWPHPEIRPLGPDVTVAFGVHDRPNRSTFKVAAEGATIALIVEVTSPESRINDLDIKRDLYFQLGVPFYAIVDRRERRSGIDVSILGYRRGEFAFEELPRNERGWIWLEPVGAWLGVEENQAMCYRRDGTAIPNYTKVTEALTIAQKHVEAANTRAEAAIAEEQKRADAAVRDRDELEKRLRDMEAELRRSRGEA